MKAWERLINYVTVRTPSDEESETVPSSVCQFDLARKLEKEMKELGLTEVVLDDKCYLYGKLPATEGKKEIPALGFIAHMDTVSDFCDHEIRPMVTENYDGGDLVLGTSGLVLSPKEFPHLTGLKGRTLLTSDGTTILGADDKAGIAEILTMIERIQTEKDASHILMTHAFLHNLLFYSSVSNSNLCKISLTIPASSIRLIPKHFLPASFKDAPHDMLSFYQELKNDHEMLLCTSHPV